MSSLTLTKTFAHPKEKVFAAFATARALAQWIAPMDNMVARVEVFQFAPGGRLRIFFDVAAETHPLEGQFLRIEAHDALSFTWVWRSPAPHADVESHVAVSLRDIATGTELKLVHSRLDAPGMSDRHSAGWQGCFSRLATYLEDAIQ